MDVLKIEEYLQLPVIVEEKAKTACYLLQKQIARRRITVNDADLVKKTVEDFSELLYFMLEHDMKPPSLSHYIIYNDISQCSITTKSQIEVFNLLVSHDILKVYEDLWKD